jgi:putative hydrolase of the HAD superfamily
VGTPVLRAVLFDADGVMQRNPSAWFDDLHALVPAGQGRAFVDDIFVTEKEAMTGTRSFREVLDEVAARWPVAVPVDELIRHWRRIEVCPATVELVRELRRTGVRCYLATNQHAYRAAAMADLGYRDLFDGAFYSCDLGATKSEPAFFTAVLEHLDLPAEEVLLVDDAEEYVETARRCGLQAVRWHIGDGLERLRSAISLR